MLNRSYVVEFMFRSDAAVKRKLEEEARKEEEEEEGKKKPVKKEPLSLDELLAKKQAEEAARSKVN